jgi:glutamine amidotransferase
VVVGHVRWASNPLKLKPAELIGMAHTQPFVYKNWLFAHNGTLLIPNEVRAELGPLAREIKGNNDSEVLFYWLMKYEAYRSPANIRRAIRGLDALWKTCRKKYPLYKYAYHGLNWVLTNGKVLIAMCYVNPGGFGKAKALCRRGEPYYQLRYKRDSSGWVVASEPLDHDPAWKSFRHGQILVTDGRRGTFSWS